MAATDDDDDDYNDGVSYALQNAAGSAEALWSEGVF